LARLGVEEALAEAGAVPGCPVTIGDVTFDWEPSTPAGVAVMLSGRGTDRRLDKSSRASAADRLAARIDRRRNRTDDELVGDAPEVDT
jgi:GTP-binding protein